MGNDLKDYGIPAEDIDFNPRSRVGNDDFSDQLKSMNDLISIHVPAWGTTSVANANIVVTRISIHVPAWGTT